MKKNKALVQATTVMVLVLFGTSCTNTRVYQLQRDDLAKVVTHKDTSPETKYGLVDVGDTRLTISSRTALYVVQKRQGGTFYKRPLTPFGFTLDQALVTPNPDQHPEGHRTPFSLSPDDRYEAHIDEFNLVPAAGTLGLAAVTLGLFFVTWLVFKDSCFGPGECSG
jgi:hypothetical protein